jgi:squalene synthase HpnC
MDNHAVGVDHYENFPVASLLCPRHLRPAVMAIYAFARSADDIADEGHAAPSERLAALEDYRRDLAAVATGRAPSARWPQVFQPLRRVMGAYAVPRDLLEDLLSAFEQDVVKHSYEDRQELLDYCRRSANPIGRLMLHLYGVQRGQALQQSDSICTALQLANFWQDLGVDISRGRLYVPLADCRRHHVDPDDLRHGRQPPGTRALVAEMAAWSRESMLRGAPLARSVAGTAGWELRLVVQGGLRILDKVAAAGDGVLERRPTLRVWDAPLMLWRAMWMKSSSPSGVRKVA